MVHGIFEHLDIGFRQRAQRVLVGGEELSVRAEDADVTRVLAGLRVRDLQEAVFLLNRIGPRIDLRREVRIPGDRLADQIERRRLPCDVGVRIDACVTPRASAARCGGGLSSGTSL